MKITCYGTKSKVEPIILEQNVQKQFCKTNIAMEKLIQESNFSSKVYGFAYISNNHKVEYFHLRIKLLLRLPQIF